MSCVVENCTEKATTAISMPEIAGQDIDQVGPWHALACDFHARALRSGETFSEGANRKIRLGTHAPPRLLDFTLKETGVALPELTLSLGHDGIVGQEVRIQISRELAEHLFMNDESDLAKEIARNQQPHD